MTDGRASAHVTRRGRCAMTFVTWPSLTACGWLLAGTLLRITYLLMLARVYAAAAFSRVYPIARGTSPLLTAFFGTLVLGEPLTSSGLVALLAVLMGVLLIARPDHQPRPDSFALQSGMRLACLITAYSLVDAKGVRASQEPLGYAAFAFVGESLGVAICMLVRDGPAAFSRAARAWRSGAPAGLFSLGSYGVALWAFRSASPARVAAVRETSVLFAMLIATVGLREHFTRRDWLGASLIAFGAAAARL